MDEMIEKRILTPIRQFRLPGYDAIPDVGLYLEQTARYISEFLAPLGDFAITGSMISNYVKKGLVDNPVKKLYQREQIAYLIFIALAKSVLSLEDLQLFIRLQKRTYDARTAYEYFCKEFENILLYIFDLKETVEEVGSDSTQEKTMLRNTIITIAHKIYLEKCFGILREIDELKG